MSDNRIMLTLLVGLLIALVIGFIGILVVNALPTGSGYGIGFIFGAISCGVVTSFVSYVSRKK